MLQIKHDYSRFLPRYVCIQLIYALQPWARLSSGISAKWKLARFRFIKIFDYSLRSGVTFIKFLIDSRSLAQRTRLHHFGERLLYTRSERSVSRWDAFRCAFLMRIRCRGVCVLRPGKHTTQFQTFAALYHILHTDANINRDYTYIYICICMQSKFSTANTNPRLAINNKRSKM